MEQLLMANSESVNIGIGICIDKFTVRYRIGRYFLYQWDT